MAMFGLSRLLTVGGLAAAAVAGAHWYYGQPGGVASVLGPPVIDTDPRAIVRAYADDEAAAGERYTGKWVRLRGTVDAVKAGPVVALDAGLLTSVYCDLAGGPTATAGLARGQEVTVTGKCMGREASGITLADCRVGD